MLLRCGRLIDMDLGKELDSVTSGASHDWIYATRCNKNAPKAQNIK